MTPLHIPSFCTECGMRLAFIQTSPTGFLCEQCFSVTSVSLSSSDVNVTAGFAPPPAVTINSCEKEGSHLNSSGTKGRWSPSRDDMETSGPALFAADEISEEMETDSSVPWSPPCREINGDLGPTLLPTTFGAINSDPVPSSSRGPETSSPAVPVALSFEAEVAALEVEWLRAGIIMNSIALRVSAASDSISKSVSVSGA